MQAWAGVLAHERNQRSRDCRDGRIACRVFQGRVFQDAKLAMTAYTLRK
jgi:hypothetical protein